MQATIPAGPSRSIGLKTIESPCTLNHLRVLSAGRHCLNSAKDLSCCAGDVWNRLMVKPGWWLFKAAWNKWFSLQAIQFFSPYLSSLEMRAHEEMIPALQSNSYRCKECICKIVWLRAAGWEIRSRQKPKSQGREILRCFSETFFHCNIAPPNSHSTSLWLK